MDFLILPTFPETFDTSSSCTCYMAETHGSDCKKYTSICVAKCFSNCTVLVCGRGVARRITM